MKLKELLKIETKPVQKNVKFESKDRKNFFFQTFITENPKPQPLTRTVKKPLLLNSAKEIAKKSECDNELTSCFSRDHRVAKVFSKRIIKGAVARVDRKQIVSRPSSLVNINSPYNNDLIEMFDERRDSFLSCDKYLSNSATALTLDSSSDEQMSKSFLIEKCKKINSFEYSMFENDIVAMETPRQGFVSLPSNFNDFNLE